MKKYILLVALLSVIGRVSAQDITINFQSKVDTVSIDSIRAINLRTNQAVKLLRGELLLLVKTSTGINQIKGETETGYIYPNPTDGDATFCFSMDKNEEVEIRLYNANGQLLRQEKQNLSQGTHRFLLKFPIAGIYYLSLIRSEGTFGFKAVYTGRKTQNISILYAETEKINSSVSDENQLKSALTDKSLDYTEGDIIQYSLFSGVNTTIVTETPAVSKTIDAEFINCIDKDNKSYKVVKIGDQWWMAENLAYLPAVSPSSVGSNTEPNYYVYGYQGTLLAAAKQNDNYTTYGVLYNWSAAKTACPMGWHLPTDDEWKQLEMTLGMTQAQADATGFRGTDQGTQMETTSGWFDDVKGTNNSGFSGLPGGGRHKIGVFFELGKDGLWWSSTELSNNLAWYRLLYYFNSTVKRDTNYPDFGFSVRCIKD